MPPRRCLLLFTLSMAYAVAAWPAGDEDDLLAPLTPTESKIKKKKKKVVPPVTPVEKRPVEPLAPSRLAVRVPDGPGGPLKDVHLLVDDKEVGVLPMEPLDVPPGEHRVTVKRVGYAPFNATVKVKDSGVTDLLATLEPVAAVVDFASDAVGVEVFIDGKSYGPVPVNDVLVTPGSHQLRAKREGYEEQTQLLIAKAGQDYAVRFSMKPVAAPVARTDRPERPPKLEPSRPVEPARPPPVTAQAEKEGDQGGTPWFGQWYVWAGAGAVAAAAAGGAVYLLQPTSPCGAQKCDACINPPESMKQFCLALRQLPFVGVGGPMP